MARNLERLSEIQDVLFATAERAVLVVLSPSTLENAAKCDLNCDLPSSPFPAVQCLAERCLDSPLALAVSAAPWQMEAI